MIVVFEGVDFCGKDTHMELVYKWLRNMWVTNGYIHSYPKKGDTPINQYLTGSNDLTDEQVAVEFLKEMLKDKNDILLESERGIVMLNRYYYSTIAYQGSKLGVDKMVDDIKQLNLPKPDFVILLDADPEKLTERRKDKDKHEKNIALQKRARKVYLDLAAKKPFDEVEWVVINVDRPVDVVSDDIKKTMQRILSAQTKDTSSVV